MVMYLCYKFPCAASSKKKELSAATSLPYLGPVDHCKKQKIDETAEMSFKETLSKDLNKSITPVPGPQNVAFNDPDSLIGKNVELALKSLLQLRFQFRKKFRNLIQNCEEALYEA